MKNTFLYNSMIILLLFAISLNVFSMSNANLSIDKVEDQIKNELEQEVIEDEIIVEGEGDTQEQELPNCPSFRDALSAYNYATNILNSQTNIYVTAYGSVSAAGGLGNQAIKSIKKIDGEGNIFCESVSKKTSMFGVNVADVALYLKDDYVLTKSTSNISDSLVANYSGDYKKISLNDYLAQYKLLPWERSYDINAESISKSNITFNGKEFKCSMVLNDKAVQRYKEKIKKTSDASSLPTFHGISVSFTIDLKGRFKTLESSDSYTINIGISANVSQNLTETYYYKNVVIDEVN